MPQSVTFQRVKEEFSDSIVGTHSELGQDTLILAKTALLEVARFLKQDPALKYNYLMDLTAVDHWKRKPRFEMVYHFFSLQHKFRLRVKASVGGLHPEIDSLTPLWPGANWYEREVYDMFGIRFKGHPDLRRLLLYPEFKGHPLRKDYPINRRQPLVGPQD
ncbi:MAG: NADH-quinone oxidoreductase subunit C [Acidobacteriota bacterium]